MKKFFGFLCVLFLTSFTSYSQNYISFPDSNARWVNATNHQGSFFTTYDIFYVNGNDTLINSKIYTKINSYNAVNSIGNYYGGLRDSAGRVHFIPKDSTLEMLLYDFTVNQGDSIWNVYGINNPSAPPFIVIFVDSVLIDGIQRKRINFSGGSWIEGIGNPSSLFHPPYISLSANHWLHCMSYDSISITNFNFPIQTSAGNCDLTVGVEEAEITEANLSVFPNPSSNILNVRISGKIKEILVFNNHGGLLKVENSSSFSIENLKEGVYFLKIQTEKNIYFHKFIKE